MRKSNLAWSLKLFPSYFLVYDQLIFQSQTGLK